jgi:zinc transport system substrate-binding protein
MTIDGSDKKIAETIRNNTKTGDQEILVLDSMQSTTADDISKGASYISIMEDNLEVLMQSLN